LIPAFDDDDLDGGTSGKKFGNGVDDADDERDGDDTYFQERIVDS
jgi:hypothetical protein